MPTANSAEAEQRQFLRMTATPIPRLVTALAIPTIFSMLISAFYNVVDTFFVARLGTSPAGAVGIVFSMMAFVQAIAFMVGIGCGSQVSRALGRRERETADCFVSSAFALALLLGCAISASGLLFTRPLMRLLGATPTILPHSCNYARCIFMGTAFFCCSIVLNNILRAEGKAFLSMLGLGFGGILNIGLDPLFIFTFDMGIAGAAVATLISQIVSFAILLSFFLTGRSITKLSARRISPDWRIYWEIVKIGLSSFSRQGLAGISTTALNIGAGNYGDAAVAAMSIVGRIFFFVLAALIGFGQGFQPVAGYNYGAGRFDRVTEAFRFTVRSGTVLLTLMAAAGFVFAPALLEFFIARDPEAVTIGVLALRAQCLALPLQPVIVISNMLFQSVGKAVQAFVVASCRQGIYFLPLVLILPRFWGLRGIQFTQTGSDLLAFLTCLPFLWFFFRELRRRQAARSANDDSEEFRQFSRLK